MKIILFIVLNVLTLSASAKHLDLDQLLQKVKREHSSEAKINQQREARFLAEKAQQQALLKKAQAQLNYQKSLSQKLKAQLEENEKRLAELESQLNDRSGELGELFGVARQAAGDLAVDLSHSVISAQLPRRPERLKQLADSKALPTITQLEELWFLLQQEMTESGKVVYFDSEIQTASGETQQSKVYRIGVFNILASNGHYLQYDYDIHRLLELARQPGEQYVDLAKQFTQVKTGPVALGIDPTRGVILSMLVQAPNVLERIDQGGIIGYIILGLGAFGLVYALYRLLMLGLIGKKIKQQLLTEKVHDDNPLGRILQTLEQNQHEDTETLELILDEALTREVPKLEEGLSLVKLLTAVAPLLGLLGTVTGMIATFQAISLFGTGDPKLMASGISQALVTTMLGLCVAIPLLFLHSLMVARSRVLVQILDEQSAGIITRRLGK
ncbi:MotA/TolQ/ExbB proton channel family protein [methane-oxidizing endosymbiont of Gigantopelta aegis]|uniref:MotA/TolQ/ExbB proton channel family protein n=1 Tax=methane-oxidizing endosymbiont of Gigantopelta aegis TaxID=2794938 RepID=UPI0018DB92CC|nr:MotA/TolQ/ExbB proton channel family protein [methane-oxidizing endosymbiont of Gigantopelta aegis]